jgi:hypothetical protein
MFEHIAIFFFVSLIIGGLFCIGLYWVSRGETEIDPEGKERKVWGNLLYPLYKYLSNPRKIQVGDKTYHEENFWAKPIIGCFVCFASFWGTIIYWSMVKFATYTKYIEMDIKILLPMWVIYCFSLSTINVFLEKVTRD